MKELDRKKYMKPARRSARLAMTLAILMLTILTPVSKAWAQNVVDLSTQDGDYKAQNGDVLTGKAKKTFDIQVNRKAEVTLRNLTLKGGIRCNNGATIILEGSNTVKQGIFQENTGNLTIKGTGSLNVTGARGTPGIGTSSQGCDIIIDGGTITATGNSHSAGIGSYKNQRCGNITINGGTVTATGDDYAAGIGGGANSTCLNITINGGTVKAMGGEKAAGIGNGCSNNADARCNKIIITGGFVTAEGGENAAGIGCGERYRTSGTNQCNGINIMGGIVIAKRSNSKAANIGAGYHGQSGKKDDNKCNGVTIGGGITRVEAKTIGGGSYGRCGSVKIASGLLQVGNTRYGPSEATFAKEGFGTYYNTQADATLPAGMKAMIVTAKGDGQTLTYETIADGSLTDAATAVVPASTAVMLQVAPSTDAQTVGGITLASPSAATISQTNLLNGAEDPNGTTTTGSGLHYKLSYNTSSTDLGWYWGVDGGGAFTSKAHKAWLVMPSTAGTRGFFGLPGDDETTGIRPPLAPSIQEVSDDAWYAIDGRMLSGKPTTKGLYIHNGRKEVVR